MGNGDSGGDIYVNLDRLKEYTQRCQQHLNDLQNYLESEGDAFLAKAANDGSRFGGFVGGQNLASRHGQLVDDMRTLLRLIRRGIETAQIGVDQSMKNYQNVDFQKSQEFDQLDQNADDG